MVFPSAIKWFHLSWSYKYLHNRLDFASCPAKPTRFTTWLFKFTHSGQRRAILKQIPQLQTTKCPDQNTSSSLTPHTLPLSKSHWSSLQTPSPTRLCFVLTSISLVPPKSAPATRASQRCVGPGPLHELPVLQSACAHMARPSHSTPQS